METFETSSINDSAFVLVTVPHRLRGIAYDGHKCVMTFLSIDGDVEEAVAAFHNGASCNAREYARQLSWLRSRVKETSNNTRPPATPLTPQYA